VLVLVLALALLRVLRVLNFLVMITCVLSQPKQNKIPILELDTDGCLEYCSRFVQRTTTTPRFLALSWRNLMIDDDGFILSLEENTIA
jgi:hypothetical protein